VDHPGDFGSLFLVGWCFGVARLVFVSRMPERSERTGGPIRIRGALSLVFGQPALRRYLLGVTGAGAVRLCVLPFVIVMMRREIGFSEGEVLYTTIALFAGGLVSLVAWGAVVDRFGAAPVFRWTSIASSALTLALMSAGEATPETLALIVATVFGLSVAASGFGVADTKVLFALTPPEAPARILVVAQVTVSSVAGLAPVLVGLALEVLLGRAKGPDERLAIYHGFFALAAVLRLVAYWPLRRLRDMAPDGSAMTADR
jgi:MFS family permease